MRTKLHSDKNGEPNLTTNHTRHTRATARLATPWPVFLTCARTPTDEITPPCNPYANRATHGEIGGARRVHGDAGVVAALVALGQEAGVDDEAVVQFLRRAHREHARATRKPRRPP